MNNETLEPVATLSWDEEEGGTYKATLTVSGLQSELQARMAAAHLQQLFCGQPQEPNQ